MENGYHDLTEEELQEYYPDDKAQMCIRDRVRSHRCSQAA